MEKSPGFRLLALCLQCLVLVGIANCSGDDDTGSSSGGSSSGSIADASTDGVTTNEGGVTQKPALLKLDPAAGKFGSVLVDQESPATTFTVTNAGETISGAIAPSITGADATSFAIGENKCTTPLAAGASCTVTVKFKPASAGAKSASLSVTGTPGGTVTASLSGDGTPPGGLGIEASTNDLGSVIVGETSADSATFTVTNTGDGPTGDLAIQAAGTDPADFILSDDECSTTVLAAKETCTFKVSFKPTSRGAKSASLEVSATPGGTVKGAIGGKGLAPAHLVTATQELRFGSVIQGKTSDVVKFFVANDGDVDSPALTQLLSGTDSSLFTVAASSTCLGKILAPTTTCEVDLQLAAPAATAVGNKTAQIAVDGGTAGSVAASLIGSVISPLQITVDPTTFAFTSTLVGQSSAAKTFTITNGGTKDSGTIVTQLSGTDEEQFLVVASSDKCDGVSLPPAGTCTITLVFAPSHKGAASAELAITSPDTGSAAAALQGVGLTPAQLTIDPSVRDFGGVPTGEPSASQLFTVTNVGTQLSGDLTATLTGTDAPGFEIANNGCTTPLAAGTSCTVEVRFVPTQTRNYAASLEVKGSLGASVTASLKGDGQSPVGLLISPPTFTFSPTRLGDTSATQTFTVTNKGITPISGLGLSVSGTNTGDFVATMDCTTIAANDSCTITASFKPSGTGRREASVVVGPSPTGSARLALAGVGRANLEVIAIDGAPPTDPYDFGDVGINNALAAADALITVRNNTDASKPLAKTEQFGQPAQYSTVSSTCDPSGTIAGSGGTCTVRVRFKPTSVGEKPGAIVFSIGSGPTNSATQNVTGSGVDAIVIKAVTSAAYGVVPSNTTSSVHQFKVTNLVGSVTTGALTVLSSNPNFEIKTNECTSKTLAPGESCLVDVVFSPHGSGQFTSTLSANGTPGGSAELTLTGTGGTQPGSPPTDITLSSTSARENLVNAPVGVLDSVDSDTPSADHVYTLEPGAGGTDNASFAIVGNQLSIAGIFDFETKSSYSIRVRSTDDRGFYFEKAFTITVIDINDAPSFTKGLDQTVGEDAPAQSIASWASAISTGGSTGPEAAQTLQFIITGNTNAGLFSVAPTVSPSGTLTYTTAANANGTATITLKVKDSGGTANGGVDESGEQTFVISITSVNDAPTFNAGPVTITLNEDAPAQTSTWATAISPGATEEASQTLTFSLTNDNLGIFDVPPTLSPAGVLMFTPKPDVSGDANLTIVLKDNGGTANGGVDTSTTKSLVISILPVNDVPKFTKGADINVLTRDGAQSLAGWATALSRGPADESGQTLTFQLSGVDTTLFTVLPTISSDGTLAFTPKVGANGSTTISVVLKDSGGTANGGVDTSAAQTFVLGVQTPNIAPVVTAGTVAAFNEDAAPLAHSIPSFASTVVGPPDESAQTVVYAVSNDANGLFSTQPAIAANGTLSFTAAADAFGTATVTVSAKDSGGTANGGSDTSDPKMFTITINAVNDKPSFTVATDPAEVDQKLVASAYSVTGFATAISVGPTNEASQLAGSTFAVVTNSNPGLFSAGPTISNTGTLTYTVAANASGTANVTFQLNDHGGTANGGVELSDVSVTRTFSVKKVNSPPVVTPAPASTTFVEGTLSAPASPIAVAASITVTDADGDASLTTAATATVQITSGYVNGEDILSYNAGSTKVEADAFDATTGKLSLHQKAGQPTAAASDWQLALRSVKYTNPSDTPTTAARTITYIVTDGVAPSVATTSTLNVTATNDPPVANPVSGLVAQAGIPIDFTLAADRLGGTDPETPAASLTFTTPVLSSCVDCVVTISANGSFSVTPTWKSAGTTVTFTYMVSDGTTNSPPATVSLNVAANQLFVVAPTGAGELCTVASPCLLQKAVDSGLANAGIFINTATGTNTTTAAIQLKTGQRIAGVSGFGTFATFFGVGTPAKGAYALPAFSGTGLSTINKTLKLVSDVRLAGLAVSTGTATALDSTTAANTQFSGVAINNVSCTTLNADYAVRLANITGQFSFKSLDLVNGITNFRWDTGAATTAEITASSLNINGPSAMQGTTNSCMVLNKTFAVQLNNVSFSDCGSSVLSSTPGDRHGINATNLFGNTNTFTNVNMVGSYEDNVHLVQNLPPTTAGTPSKLVVSTSSHFNDSTIGNGFYFDVSNTANAAVVHTGSTFTGNALSGFRGGITTSASGATSNIKLAGSTVSTNDGDGIRISNNNGNSKFEVSTTTISLNGADAFLITQPNTTTGGTLHGIVGTVAGNSMTISSPATSGGGVVVSATGQGKVQVDLQHLNITAPSQFSPAVAVVSGDGLLGETHVRMQATTVSYDAVFQNGTIFNSGVTAASTRKLFAEIGGTGLGNTITRSGASGLEKIRLKKLANSTFNIAGLPAATTDPRSYVASLNTSTVMTDVSVSTTGNFTAAAVDMANTVPDL